MTSRLWWALLVVLIAGCRALPPPKPLAPARPQPASIAELAATIKADAQQSDRAPDSRVRGELADDASRNSDACLAMDPEAAACLYGRAVALGLEARTHPTRANELLKKMLDALARAETADPDYDEAGPARVRALVLIKAPGWPLGPGDADEGLIAARRAASLRPNYPANLLALAEALTKTGDAKGAKATYARARESALAMPESPERDDWVHEADRGLRP